MNSTKYKKGEIDWALSELKRKRPEQEPTVAQAIKLLDTFGKFKGMIADKIDKDSKKVKTNFRN